VVFDFVEIIASGCKNKQIDGYLDILVEILEKIRL
jgi:hypothetical protein